MPFTFEKLKNGAVLITPKLFEDPRGFFFESYKFSDFVAAGITKPFVQDNQSFSIKNVFRGIHFQRNPKPQGKLVRCIRGVILDIAVDLRRDSPTFKCGVSVFLNEFNRQLLWVPEGYGHAFFTISDSAEVHYKCTEEYDSKLDAGIIWSDPTLKLDCEIIDPILSEKDKILPFSEDIELF